MIFAKNILVNWFRVKDFCKKFIVLQTKSLGDGLMAGMIFAKNILVNWFRVKDFVKSL